MSQTSLDELKKIGQAIASLPSQELLDRCQNEAERNEWHNYKKNQLLLAEAWEAEFILGQGDPIHDALEKKEISKHRHKMLQEKVLLYKCQWELIKAANQYVEKWHNKISEIISKFSKHLLPRRWNQSSNDGVVKYPFASAFDLFAETLKEEVDGSFSWCLEPYYDVPVKKWRKASNLLIKNIEKADAKGVYPELKPTELDNLKNQLVWSKLGFSWLGVTLLVCQFVAKSDRALAEKLIAYNRQLVEYTKVGVRASRQVRGFAWSKGKIMPASKTGGTYHESE
jgi:hypothetical protein